MTNQYRIENHPSYNLDNFHYRERWLAELDIDPSKTSVAKLAVCSLHFREGLPTDQYPLPTELLAEKSNEKVEFKGTRLSISDQDFSADETSDTAEDGEQFKFSQIASKKIKKPIKERMKMAVRARYFFFKKGSDKYNNLCH